MGTLLRTGALLSLLLLASGPPAASAERAPEELVAEAKSLLDRRRYEESLPLWLELIEQHRKHESVRNGDAQWYASRCLRHLGEPVEAAKLLESYLKAFPKGKGALSALIGIFEAYADAGEEKLARKAGNRVLASWPDAKGAFRVLRAWLERGWEAPRLRTSYDVLYRWTFDEVDAEADPDLRLALLDLIEAQYGGEKLVKDGGILYCRAWCHQQAGRLDRALEIGEKHLKLFPRDVNRDKTRVLMARILLDLDPPEKERANELLRAILANPETRYRSAAEELLGRGTGGARTQVTEGCPRPEGVGKVVLLTNLPGSSAWIRSLSEWRKARDAEIVHFRGSDPKSAARSLRRLGPEFVAVVVPPGELDNNLQLGMLELCRELDGDPLPDFHFGYLTARDPGDLEKLAARILVKDGKGGETARIVGTPSSGGQIDGLDLFLHFGHGTPRRIVGGLTAGQVAGLTLPRAPVIVSGACLNAVCGKSFESSMLENVYQTPSEVAPDEAISLAWLHAGATGFVAALDGDRGEMAMAEWEYLLEHAPPLGEVIGRQYRLVFTSLPERFESFPRYVAGRPIRKGFYDVMLRGMTSRILFSDPSYRPLKEPLAAPTTRREVDTGGDGVVVTVTVLRHASGPFINTLPSRAGIPFRETRLHARVPLPEGFEGHLGRPDVSVTSKGTRIELTRYRVRHEVWGGRRYVNVQAESADRRLASAGTAARFTFPVREP